MSITMNTKQHFFCCSNQLNYAKAERYESHIKKEFVLGLK